MNYANGMNSNGSAKQGTNGFSNGSVLRRGVDANGLNPSTMAGAQLSMQQQHQQTQHQVQQQGAHTGGATSEQQSGLLYDLSSFDPLQAHALQLTAQAGLTNILTPQPAPGTGAAQHSALAQPRPHAQPLHQQPHHSQHTQHSQVEQQQIQHQQQAPGQPTQLQQITQKPPQPGQQAPQQQQNAYYYIQPQGGSTSTLQPIAPATQQVAPAGMVIQAPLVGQAAQNFILPATAQGATIAVPANFQAPIFPSGLTPTAAPGVLPNLLMTQHFQSVVANAASQQQPQQQALLASAKKREQDDASSPYPPTKKKREVAPSVVSSSTTSTDSSGQGGGSSKIAQGSMQLENGMDPQVDMSNMTPAERRRYERNLREQQRSYRISQQIKELRDVLTESKVPFKPNKYSILLSVVEYIKQLQARAIMLDAEHQKLITTIRQTNELVNSGNTPSSADETDATNLTGNTSASDSGSDSEMLFVQGLDYRSLFEQCPAALGIAALDGRILECNPEFQLLLGFPRDEILKQSLFNLVRNHQDIFRAMAEMLKFAEEPPNGQNPPSATTSTTTTTAPMKCRFWSGPVVSKRDTKLSMNLTLTVGEDGSPKFFSCALTNS